MKRIDKAMAEFEEKCRTLSWNTIKEVRRMLNAEHIATKNNLRPAVLNEIWAKFRKIPRHAPGNLVHEDDIEELIAEMRRFLPNPYGSNDEDD